jgi:hypothetical protein
MNANLRRTLIALAVLSVFSVSAAYADQDGGTTSTSVKITKKVSLTSDVNVNGNVQVTGNIDINAAAVALSSANQYSDDNTVNNNHDVSNQASISGNVGQSTSGNVGVNQASGDFNAQGNSAAIAAGGTGSSSSSDADFTFGGCGGGSGGWSMDGCGKDPGGSSSAGAMADAETFATQKIESSTTHNHGTTDNAKISGSAFQGDSGNIGVNQVAGNGNEQLNQLAAATNSDNVYALATSTLDQEWSGNSVSNDPGTLGWCSPEQATTNTATLSGSVAAEASGNIGLNQAAGTGNMQSNSLSLAAANTTH